MAGLDDTWGGSVRMNLGFKDRGRLLPSVRNLVVELCSECIESHEKTQQLVLALQELLENLVKYSASGRSALDFELLMLGGQATARITTRNRAPLVHLREAQALLDRIIATPEPVALMDSLVASSGERAGSQLGLARLRAEVGLELTYSLDDDQLCIEACCAVQPRRTP